MDKRRKINASNIYIFALIVILVIGIILVFSLQNTVRSFEEMEANIERYNTYRDAFDDVRDASSYLTNEARYFVATGDKTHLENYLEEVRETKIRDNALETIYASEGKTELYEILENSARTSNELMLTEVYAMILAADAFGVDISDLSLDEFGVTVAAEDLALPVSEKKNKAIDLMFNDEYIRMKSIIEDNVYAGVNAIIDNTRSEKNYRTEETHRLLVRENFLITILIVLMVLAILMTLFLILLPIRKNIAYIKEDKKLPRSRVSELDYLSDAYNSLYDERKKDISQLSFEATHDALTGLYNRKAFEEELPILEETDIALMLVDVDYFKSVNDTYGHDVGDLVLKGVADVMQHAFRSSDMVFRLGGDEFAVILVNMQQEYKTVLTKKIQRMREKLAEKEGDPKVTLSIGVAFRSDPGEETLFKKADLALYESKENGRNCTHFYDPALAEKEERSDIDKPETAH